jgi:hypothetical protein
MTRTGLALVNILPVPAILLNDARTPHNSGGLEMLAAIRRASSRVSKCAAERRPVLKISTA